MNKAEDAIKLLSSPQLMEARALLIAKICYYNDFLGINYRLRDINALIDQDLVRAYENVRAKFISLTKSFLTKQKGGKNL